jgi:ABC-type sugar transport system ATPase subunit
MTHGAGTSVLRARGLRKHYGHGEGLVRAVDGVDLDVAPGETLAVMGPSGCGKSTLLHLLGGLDRPSGGEVCLAGRRIDQIGEKALARMRRTGVGFVFQAFHLMEELTAVENVELAALLADSVSGSRSPGRSPTSRSSSSPTNPPATSTAPRPSRSCGSSRACTRRGRRWSSCPTTRGSRPPPTG